MNHEKLSHEQLAAHIEEELHVNVYEHRENVVKFVGLFLIYGVAGVLIGGALDQLIRKAQGPSPGKGSCWAWLFGNLGITGLAFFAALLIKRGVKFDDWLMGTFGGFIFALCFFTAQSNLSNNMQCIFE